MEISSEVIPSWFVASMMVYTGFMWLVTRTDVIRMDSRITGITFIIEAVIYGVLYQFLHLDVEIRGFFSRLMVIILCLSQSLPLTVAYLRSLNRGKQ